MHESFFSEVNDRPTLDRLKITRLRELLQEILPLNGFYAKKLADVQAPQDICSLEQIEDWPFTSKEELVASVQDADEERPCLPGNLTYPIEHYVRYHQTSGTHGRPLPVFDTADDWRWWMDCWQDILVRSGVMECDRVFVASSYGPYIGFWSAFDAIIHFGATAVPTGGLSSRARLELMRSVGATVLIATPSYALHLIEVASEVGIDPSALPIRLIIVAGEPGGSSPAIRTRLHQAWGAVVIDHAGATEVGPWGVGDQQGQGLHILESWFHPEFLSLKSGSPASDGELSELVLTTLGRTGAPVIRYRTGDVVRPHWPTASETDAYPWVQLVGGVVGRVDEMFIVRGVNIFPQSIDDIVRSFPEILEYRLSVFSQNSLDAMVLEIEDHLNDPDRVAMELQVRLGLKIEVTVVPKGSLPRFEGKGKRIIRKQSHFPR
ncbi:MAG: AMP-binding protein [Pirellulales bacterium]